MPFVFTNDANGNRIKVEVSENVAKFMAENDRYIVSQQENEQDEYWIVHFETSAWENMRELSGKYSAEDISLGVPDEVTGAERAHYLPRRARCRCVCQKMREACTPTQWRRFCLHVVDGKTYRAIAQSEGANWKSVEESILSAKKKIENILMNIT